MEGEGAQAQELFCFKDLSRPCGADCMAYLSEPPDGDDYRGQSWASCRLLVDSHRGAKHLIVLTQQVGKLVTLQSNEVADRNRNPKAPAAPR